MLLALIVCQLSALVAASPFHKYPFVFLLDVGNEELEKTNSEQIRVSAPGGSIALRYPAIGYGNTIGHVRVSGIDFGTDLKANIVDGGPGYKYVTLVFMGKPGAPYDAIVTVQTVFDDDVSTQNVENVVNSESNTYQSEEDANNSAEDLSDIEESNAQNEVYTQSANAELMQSSSNIYSYVQNESEGDNEDDDSDDNSDYLSNENNSYNTDDETENNPVYSDDTGEESIEQEDSEDVSNAKDIHTQYAEDIDEDISDVQAKSTDLENEDNEENYNQVVNFDADNVRNSPIAINRNSYQAIQDHLNFGNEVYSQEEFQDNSRPVYQEDPLDYEDPYGEVVNDGVDKYRDSNNNNYLNSDDSYAVAY